MPRRIALTPSTAKRSGLVVVRRGRRPVVGPTRGGTAWLATLSWSRWCLQSISHHVAPPWLCGFALFFLLRRWRPMAQAIGWICHLSICPSRRGHWHHFLQCRWWRPRRNAWSHDLLYEAGQSRGGMGQCDGATPIKDAKRSLGVSSSAGLALPVLSACILYPMPPCICQALSLESLAIRRLLSVLSSFFISIFEDYLGEWKFHLSQLILRVWWSCMHASPWIIMGSEWRWSKDFTLN